jgi:hypothetical protein
MFPEPLVIGAVVQEKAGGHENTDGFEVKSVPDTGSDLFYGYYVVPVYQSISFFMIFR